MINLIKLKENSPEQRQAITDAQNGDKIALENLLKANEALIVSRIYTLSFVLINNDFDDLMQEGRIGLIEAIKDYDFSYDTAFSTYAVFKIDKTTINITEYKRQKLSQYNKAYDELSIILGRIPTVKELAKALNVKVDEIIEIQKLLEMKTLSINTIMENLEGEEILEYYIKEQEDTQTQLEDLSMQIDFLNTLAASNLTNDEIIILLLRFGIRTPNFKEYTLEEISPLLGLTVEAVRIKEKNSINKIRNNPVLFNLIEYSENPSLTFRKLKIKQAISTKKTPYSTTYPNFYSFFPEYTHKEIDDIIDKLSSEDKRFLQTITIGYNKKQSIKLYEIISYIYNELISTFGKRPLIFYEQDFNTNKTTNSKVTKQRLNEIFMLLDAIFESDSFKEEYTFWDYFKGYDKELIKRSLMYTPDEHYRLLLKRYGENLDKAFIKGIDDTKDLLIIKGVIDRIKKHADLLKKNKMISNIYLYFDKYPKYLIDKAIKKLSTSDKAILHKRFGPNLKKPYQELELVRLTAKEYARLSIIIKLLEKDLLNEYNLIKAKDIINIPQTIYSIFSNYDKYIIIYSISRLNNNHRQTIFNIFGSNLTITFNDLKEKNLNPKELDTYKKNTIQCIKNTLIKLKDLSIEELLRKEKRKFNQNIDNVYIDEIINSNNNLFEEEKEVLAESLSIGIENISTLPKNFQLAFYGIINKLIKEYISKEEYFNTLSSITKNYTPNPTNIENSMILFLYLGIGKVEPVPIPIISKTFNLEESKIKEIILLELNKLKETLLLNTSCYNKLVKQLK